MQELVQLVQALNAGIDCTKLCTGYICRSCTCLLDKYCSMHRDLCTRLTEALPILPKMKSLELPLQGSSATEPEVSVQSILATSVEVSTQSSSATEVSLPRVGKQVPYVQLHQQQVILPQW